MPRPGYIVYLLAAALLAAGCGPTAKSSSTPGPIPTVTGAAMPPPAGAPAGASSPEDAWVALLAAMRAGDERTMAHFATSGGIASLEAGARGEAKAAVFRRWGEDWLKWSIRWKARTADRARAMLGPEVKEAGLDFTRTPEGWKLDRWSPGE